MKYIVVLGDGMADYKIAQLGDKTPLEIAKKPYMDKIAGKGILGLVKTVPDNMPPGSDVANLSVMGYNPDEFYTGRSPLEAVSMGVNVLPTDTTFRTNLVTLSDEPEYKNKTMVSYSADEITTEEARSLIYDVNKSLGDDVLQFFGGISYRHLLVWHELNEIFNLTPPHDISGKKITDFLPSNHQILQLMEKSYEILKDHPINLKRIQRGLKPANSIWIWGQGKKPSLTSFAKKYNISGAVISAVDLIKGIGICADLESIDVEGATGTLHTNFEGKAQKAIEALEKYDFVYIHIEAPDECGHQFDISGKVRSIELIDEKIIKPVMEAMSNKKEDFSIMILPDHATPALIGTHTREAVPFAIYKSNNINVSELCYNEKDASEGIYINEGHTLMDYFILGDDK